MSPSGAALQVERPRGSWRISLGLGVGVSLFFLYLTFHKVDLSGVRTALSTVSIPILALALLTRAGAFLALALRTRMTTAPAGRLSFGSLLLSHLLGYTGNNVLPLRLGELLRIDYLARREGPSRSFLLGTAVVERLLDVLMLLALFAMTVPTVVGRSLSEGSFFAILAGTGVLLGGVLLVVRWSGLPASMERWVAPFQASFAHRLRGVIERGAQGLASLFHARWGPRAIGATVLYWLFSAGSVRIVMAAFGLSLPWYAPAVVLAMTALGTALPSSPAFVGTYDYFAALGVSMLGVDASTSTSFAVVAHTMAVVPYSVLGLVVFIGVYPGTLRLDRKGPAPAPTAEVGKG
jgi:glycosyltransferase 2 family protein